MISVGVPPLWLLLLPLTMAGAFKIMQRWGWLAPIQDRSQQRRGLLSLFMAPFCVVLVFVAFPVYFLLLILFGSLIGLLVFVYVQLSGAHILPRQQENLSIIGAAIVIAICWSFLYCGFYGYALRRFTRAWHRPLFLQMVAWTCASIPIAVFVTSKVNWSHASAIPLQPLWPIIMQWAIATFLVSQMGALFGKWLASPARSETPGNITSLGSSAPVSREMP